MKLSKDQKNLLWMLLIVKMQSLFHDTVVEMIERQCEDYSHGDLPDPWVFADEFLNNAKKFGLIDFDEDEL